MIIRVYGDIMLDRWIYGDAVRLSPEAPVPVLRQTCIKENVGGAGNVAVNLSSLGHAAHVYGTVGQDQHGSSIRSLLQQHHMQINLSDSPKTTVKTRLISNNHHMARFDDEVIFHSAACQQSLISDIKNEDLVLISDYAKGAVSADTVPLALSKTPWVMVDPKQAAEYYRGAWLVKPNLLEFTHWGGSLSGQSAFDLMSQYDWEWLVVTAGSQGIHVFDRQGTSHHFMEPVHEVIDVSGAGDTVLAVLAHCIAQRAHVPMAAKTACHAASKVVARSGVSAVTLDDIN